MADNPWLALCRTERENLRAAFDRALETANRRATLELFWRVSIFWLITGAMDEGERWSDAVLAFADELDAPELVQVISIASEFPAIWRRLRARHQPEATRAGRCEIDRRRTPGGDPPG
jgi:hypothetical protein